VEDGKLRREKLKRYVHMRILEAEEKSYDYWKSQNFPIAYEDTFEGESLAVEIDLLEITPEYIHLIIDASGGFWTQFTPVHEDTLIKRIQE
jgi:hypothetical protein